MKYRKKSKILPVKSKLPSPGTWSPESETRLKEFMDHAIGRHADAYLKNLAMTVVHLKAMSEIAALQSDLLKEAAQIVQARHQLILDRKEIAGIRSSMLQSEETVEGVKSPTPAEALKLKETVKKNIVKQTPFWSGRRRG